MAGRAVAIVVVAVVAFPLAGCSGSAGRSAAPTPTGRQTSGSQLPPIYPGTTVPPLPSSTSTEPPPSATSVRPAPGARAFSGDGTFRMGEDIQPGTYRSPGGISCSWERLRGFRGTSTDVIEHGEGIEPQVVQIAPSDAGFRTQGCGDWTPQSGAMTTTPSSTTPVALPPGAQACPTSAGPAGGFTHSAVGSSETSCPFAEQVRLAYGAGGAASSTPRQVDAVSPVTGQHYTMTCIASASLVTCSGGTDAVVYVY